MPGPDPDRARTRSRPARSGSVRLGKSELSLAGPVLVSLDQLEPVVKVRPGQGQAHPGSGPANSRKTQPKSARACLSQHLAGPVRSGPYQIWTCPRKSQDHATPGQVTARQYKNELALTNLDWASLNQLRRVRTKIRQNRQARLELGLGQGRVGNARPDQGEPKPARAMADQTGPVRARAKQEQNQSRIEPSRARVFQPGSGS